MSFRTHHSRIACVFPDDCPQRLVRFNGESELSWAELNRHHDANPETMRRWGDAGMRPDAQYLVALLNLADSLGLGHLFTEEAAERR